MSTFTNQANTPVVAHAVAASGDAHAVPNFNRPIDEAGARAFLAEQRWPTGLQNSVVKNLSKVPVRFFICDDSGSMSAEDGTDMIFSKGKTTVVGCSRWKELSSSIKFHAGLTLAADLTSEFRFLNSSAIRLSREENNREALLNVLDASPSGGTPLCRAIREVIAQITLIKDALYANGQKAVVVIATDGESSDGDIAAAMKPLEHLPVTVVVRLCTNEEKIVEYWDNIDGQLEISLDVLDDLEGEAQQVHKVNNWLTYGKPLHLLREFSVPIRELDFLDEKTLTPDQVRVVCAAM